MPVRQQAVAEVRTDEAGCSRYNDSQARPAPAFIVCGQAPAGGRAPSIAFLIGTGRIGGSTTRGSTGTAPERSPCALLSKRHIGLSKSTHDWLPSSGSAAFFRDSDWLSVLQSWASDIVSALRYYAEGADGVGCGNPSPTTRTHAKRSSCMATFPEQFAQASCESISILVPGLADGDRESRQRCLEQKMARSDKDRIGHTATALAT